MTRFGNGIFKEFKGFFSRANWSRVSTEMVESENGVFVEASKKFFRGFDRFGFWASHVDESGLDDQGVDRYDEVYNSKSNKSKGKIDGKRL